MTLFIITGTSRGLGKAIVTKLLLRDDFIVLSVGRTISDEQYKLLHNQHPRFFFVEIDLNELNLISQKLSERLELILQAEKIFFVNNAGTISPIGSIGSLDETEILQSINVNVGAPALICNFLMKHVSDKTLHFVNISSGAAKKRIEGWALYCSGKAFAQMFFNILNGETKDDPLVRVSNINPGVIDTDMQLKIRQADPHGFPKHEHFVLLKNENKLQSSESAAQNILSEIGV